jgi:conjugative transfer signal peptidase TraF
MRKRTAIVVAGAALLLLIPRAARPLLVWNATPSVPRGLYAVTAPTDIVAGDLVIASPPAAIAGLAAARHYLPRGVPLVKRVAAVPGEPICASGELLRAPRGVLVRRLRRDSGRRLLPWWQGCGRLPATAYLLLVPDVAASFDGRYFGPVARDRIIGKAHPLWLL